MCNSDQPQNTEQKLVRDAAVQISDEGQTASRSKYDKAFDIWWKKRDAILEGALKQQERWTSSIHKYAAEEMATVLAMLTSADKSDRELGKKRVREMIKLAKEDQK